MARVDYTPIKEGDLRDTKDINAIFDAIAAESANVTRENWAEEGLDQSAFVASSQGRKAFPPVKVTVAGNVTPGVALVPLVIGAVTVNAIGPFVLAANERMLFKFRAQYVSIPGTPGIPVGQRVEIQLQYDSGGPVVVPATNRAERPTSLGVDKTVSTMHVIDGPLTVASVEVRCAITGGATFRMNHASLSGFIFQRVSL